MSGPLRSPKHDQFAQALAQGKTIDEAAAAIGLKPRTGYSARLAARPEVVERIAELRALAVKAHNSLVSEAAKIIDDRAAITLESLIEEADQVKRRALADFHPNYGAAVSALTLKARLAGFLHDKPAAAAGDTYNIAFIKAPPQETFEQFNERRTRQLRLVGTSARPANGSGRRDLVS